MFRIVLPCIMILCSLSLSAQENRTFDGTGNNISNPDWGAANTQFIRVAPENYNDGVFTLGGPGWPNPRVVSNELFAQTGLVNDPLGLSDYCWVFGQFVDHDITLAPDDPTQGSFVYIQVPAGDPWFDPFNIGQALIPMRRSTPFPGTGTGPDNPRQHTNIITAYIDASAVYGSNQATADWLRSFTDGKLKVSAGNQLPFNTTDGEYDSPVDPSAPHMDDPVGMGPKHYVAGDARANENALLISFHTLFVREHNRLCDQILVDHPDWSDEDIYQHARRLVSGMLQSIVYEEWLPTMGVDLPPYNGYDPSVHAGIFNVFSAAAFRLGHTLLNDTIRRVDLDGNIIAAGNLPLNQAFFNPMEVYNEGVEPYFKGMGVQVQQGLDSKVIDGVRNFLFGPPGAGGLDLASINITRGRERGIPALNDVRVAFGLAPHTTFADITGESTVSALMENLYGSLDSLDAWVGMLAEAPMPNALFGETIMKIMEDQFAALRDGDRFYYLNDPALTPEDIALIQNTTLEAIICRNTGIDVMQENVFVATPHEMLCTTDEPFALINGAIQTETGANVADVSVEVQDLGQGLPLSIDLTDGTGLFAAPDLPTCEGYRVVPQKDIGITNGVTTLDLVAVQKHILGLELFQSPYQHIAADANLSNTVSTLDMVEIRKVILLVSTSFPNNTSWRFVDASYQFEDPDFPLVEDFPEYVDVANLNDTTAANFIAVKVGDVNDSANPANLDVPGDRSGSVQLMVMDAPLVQDEWQEVTIYLEENGSLAGLQFALDYDPTLVEFGNWENISLTGFSAENVHHHADDHLLAFSWNGEENVVMESDLPMLKLLFRARRPDLTWQDVFVLRHEAVPGEVYDQQTDVFGLDLTFDDSADMLENFALYQTIPNPAHGMVRIPFFQPSAGEVRLTLFTSTGVQVYESTIDFSAGTNFFEINADQFAGSGSLFYRVESEDGGGTRQMIRIE